MTYKEYKDAKQKEYNDLPIFYAFSNEQFKEHMEERGLTENDVDQVFSIGCGGYFLKKDKDIIHAFFSKKDDLPELMKDYNFALDAIYYEMGNHEYHINWQGKYDVCSCFGAIAFAEDDENELENYFAQLGWTDTTKKAYVDAHKKFMKDALKNDWY